MAVSSMRLICIAICAWTLVAGRGPLVAAEPSPEVEKILGQMADERDAFDPRPLHELGEDGLQTVLDRLLPDTAADAGTPEQRQRIAELIRQLGDEQFAVREQAMARLIEAGSVCRPAVAAAAAAESDDPEMRFRARRILAAWRTSDKENIRQYAAAFAVYARGIQDAPRLGIIAQRTAVALKTGMADGGRMDVLTVCLEVLARGGNDEFTDPLLPLVSHDDVRIAILVTQRIGLNKPAGGRFPRLLLAALASDREALAASAIPWTANCKDEERAAEIVRLLHKILSGDKQPLRLAAAIALLNDHYEPAAAQFLIDELRSGDVIRVNRALLELGKSNDVRFPAADDLLEVLFPLLKVDDDRQRLAAASAVGCFAGESVVRSLVPLLDDRRSNIIRTVARKLQSQPDQEMLRRVLTEAREQSPKASQRLQTQLDKLLKSIP